MLIDDGTEFYNKIFMNFLKDNGVTLYSTFNEGKVVVIEHFNRTLKERLYKKIRDPVQRRYDRRQFSNVMVKPNRCLRTQQYFDLTIFN